MVMRTLSPDRNDGFPLDVLSPSVVVFKGHKDHRRHYDLLPLLLLLLAVLSKVAQLEDKWKINTLCRSLF